MMQRIAAWPERENNFWSDAAGFRAETAITLQRKTMHMIPAKSKQEIVNLEVLYISMRRCTKGVIWKDSVAGFAHYWLKHLTKLKQELENGSYKARKARIFMLYVPKKREIMSVVFRDRVYQRALNDFAIYPAISRSLIYDNYACRKGMGPEFGRNRLTRMLRRHFINHGLCGWVLSCDIEGYYPNMPHWLAKKTLRRYLPDEIYFMAEEIIDNQPGTEGFYPGSQIIQLVGISALNQMDHYIKERLMIRAYGRYMDDFFLIHEDKSYLEYVWMEIERIVSECGMKLNAKKTKMRPLSQGMDFLGYHFSISDTGAVYATILSKKVRRERRLLRKLVKQVKEGKKTLEKVDEHLGCWLATASYGNTTKVRQRMMRYYTNLLKEVLGNDIAETSAISAEGNERK